MQRPGLFDAQVMVGILLLVVVVIAWIAWEVQVGGAGVLPGGRAAQLGACPTRILPHCEVPGLLPVKEEQRVSDSQRQAQSAPSAIDSAVWRTGVLYDEGELSHRWAVPPLGSAGSGVARLRIQTGPAGQSSRLFSVWFLRCRKEGPGCMPCAGLGNFLLSLALPALK
ncbi:MAG: hypothetical protein WHT09_04285 [Thermogutta sp.]